MTYNDIKFLNDKNKRRLQQGHSKTIERIEYVRRGSNSITFKYQGKETTTITVNRLIDEIVLGHWYVSNISYLKYEIAKLDVDTSFVKHITTLEQSIAHQKEIGRGEIFFTSLVGKDAYFGNKLLYNHVRDYILNKTSYMIVAKPRHKEGKVVFEPSEYIVWDVTKMNK